MGRAVRLACVRHAASVRPEPGSNSPLKSFLGLNRIKGIFVGVFCLLFNFQGSFPAVLFFVNRELYLTIFFCSCQEPFLFFCSLQRSSDVYYLNIFPVDCQEVFN